MMEIDGVNNASQSAFDVTAEILLECSGEAIYAIDKEGVCIFANPVCVDTLGYRDVSEIIGLNIYSHMLTCTSASQRVSLSDSKVYAALMSGQECHVDSECFLRKDGSCFPVAYSVYPLSLNNVTLGSVITFSDISERKEIEAALKRSEEVLSKAQEIAHIGSWDWNIVTNELRWSDEIYRIFGLKPQEFSATYEVFLTRVDPSDRQAVADAVNRAVTEDSEYSIEHKVIRPDGVIRVVHEQGKVYRNEKNEAIRMIGTVHDITDRKQAEDRIIQLNEELELRVSLRTQELQVANKELKNSLRNLSLLQNQLVESAKMASLGGLVAGVAHEINTPLGIGVTVASLMKDKVAELQKKYSAGEMTQEDFEDFIKVIGESSPLLIANLSRAANLVKSFKMVAVDSSCDEKRLFKVREYIDTVLESLKPKLTKLKVHIVLACDEDLEFYADPGSFSQIVTNLVMNSLLHGFEGRDRGVIMLGIRQNAEQEVVIEYTDDGVGMPSSVVARVFEPFFTTKRNQGGTGLGMHIVYNLVSQSLGGRIHCASNAGKGVHFDIVLPCSLMDKQHLMSRSA